MPKIKNEDIAIRTLADHFDNTYEAMRQLRRKWDESKTGLWIVYVKAYNFDTGIQKNAKEQTEERTK